MADYGVPLGVFNKLLAPWALCSSNRRGGDKIEVCKLFRKCVFLQNILSGMSYIIPKTVYVEQYYI
jgi:hypothetical protein